MKIGSVQKNSQEEIRVTIQDYQGTELIDLRTYWQNSEGKWLPTRKGISLTCHVVADVINLLQRAAKKMQTQTKKKEDESLSDKDILEIIRRL